MVRVRGCGDADVVRVEERNEHERDVVAPGKMGRRKWVFQAQAPVGRYLGIPLSCTQNTMAKLRAGPVAPGALGQSRPTPAARPNNLCASTINAPKLTSEPHGFHRRRLQLATLGPSCQPTAPRCLQTNFSRCICIVCTRMRCAQERSSESALYCTSVAPNTLGPLSLSLYRTVTVAASCRIVCNCDQVRHCLQSTIVVPVMLMMVR